MEPNASTDAVALPPPPPQGLSRIRELMSRAWSFYKANFKRLWPLFILGSIAETGLRLSYDDRTGQVQELVGSFDPSLGFIVGMVLLGIIVVLFFALSSLALMRSIVDIRNGDYQGIRSAYKKSLALFPAYILVAILGNLALIGGDFLLIIPGIIIAIYVSFGYLVLVDENKRGFSALLGSWELVSGKWWRTLGRFIVFTLAIGGIIMLAILALLLVALFGGYVLSGIAGAAKIAAIAVLVILFLAVMYLFAVPLGILFTFELYYDLKRVRGQSVPLPEGTNSKRRKLLIVSTVFGAVMIPLSIFFIIKVLPSLLERFEGKFAPAVYIPVRGELEYENRDFNLSAYYPKGWEAGESVSEGVQGTPGVLDVSFSPSTGADSGEALQLSASFLGFYPDASQEEEMRRGITELGVNYIQTSLSSAIPADEEPAVELVAFSTVPVAGVFAEKSEHIFTHQRKTYRAWIAGFYVHDRGYMALYLCEERACAPERFETFLAGLDPFYDHAVSGSDYRYESLDYGLEFTYPQDVLFMTTLRNEGVVAHLARSRDAQESTLIVTVEALKFSLNSVDFDDQVEEFRQELMAEESVSGVTGGRVEREGAEAAAAFDFTDRESPRKVVFIFNDGMLYRLMGSVRDEKEIAVFDKIASSFRVLPRADAVSESLRSSVGDYGITLALSPTESLGHFDDDHPLYKDTIHVVWMEPSSDTDQFHPRIFFVIPYVSPSSKAYLSKGFWNDVFASYEERLWWSSEDMTLRGYPAQCRRYLTKSASGTALINNACLIVKGSMVRVFTFTDDEKDFGSSWPRAKAILDSVELR